MIKGIEREDIEALAESPVFRGMTSEEKRFLVDEVRTRYGGGLSPEEAGEEGAMPAVGSC